MSMTRILLLNTSRGPTLLGRTTAKTLRPLLPPNTQVKVSWPRRWYESIHDETSHGRAVTHIIAQVDRHRKDYDAVVVNHHSDGGIEAVRGMVEVPVVGIGESTVWLARYLVDRFSMITFATDMRKMDKRIVQKMGLLSGLVSIRVPVAELSQLGGVMGGAFQEENLPTTREVIIQQCIKAVAEDGAEAVILGGSPVGYLMPGIEREAQRRLADEGYPNIPVIEPLSTAFHMAKMLVDLGLRRLP